MIVTLDIETIPAQRDDLRELVAAGVKPPGTLKKADIIAEWEKTQRAAAVEDAIGATSFDGGMGQIVVIGWAIDSEPAQSMQVRDLTREAEADVLAGFFASMRRVHSTSGQRPVIVGHNVAAFDLPFIWKRAMVHGIRPPLWIPRDPKPWGETVFDTMTQWAGVKDRISMDKLCVILGIPGKGGISGADVWPLVQSGELDKVAAYCRADVERTRAIYQRMNFEPVKMPTPDRQADAPPKTTEAPPDVDSEGGAADFGAAA